MNQPSRFQRAIGRVRSALGRGLSLGRSHRKEGDRADAIPFGEERWGETYAQRVARLEDEIESGGRGDLSAAASEQELDHFTSKWNPETWSRRRRCAECGVRVGRTHEPGCDVEQCPHCDEQRAFCPCP